MSDYCHLCDADPCYCGQRGKVTNAPAVAKVARGGPRGLDDAMREFVLRRYEEGVLENYAGWLALLEERFGSDKGAVRNAWNRVSNQLQRDWLLIDVHEGDEILRSPSHYPDMRHLSVDDCIQEIEQLIERGGWSVGEKGLRLHEVWRRIPNVVYISVYDALHAMKDRGHLVTTVAPSGKPSQFWYVRGG
ncbi:hypothetical protein [Nocardioides sp.]|uniref:hypothetical protein n=1 Tax=Nocardioides sp. TaxID=35761 RepID=UPI00261B3EC8|nr:hypothetical protein [Nocardioides sp.]